MECLHDTLSASVSAEIWLDALLTSLYLLGTHFLDLGPVVHEGVIEVDSILSHVQPYSLLSLLLCGKPIHVLFILHFALFNNVLD